MELPTAVGTAQPTLANFGSATFSEMTYNPASPGAGFLSGIDMIDERQCHRNSGTDDVERSCLVVHR